MTNPGTQIAAVKSQVQTVAARLNTEPRPFSVHRYTDQRCSRLIMAEVATDSKVSGQSRNMWTEQEYSPWDQ
ncbi:hypothetical protein RvY_01394 [Ramazzottius varieornatus]|uniref:Uncharacterized protein n=1 Tax=Ramazzottius varieornatus TaxID=947166 RepID=A0A1D1UNA5_RAMVA|nr:hypothetical protein RvY_01394 [Ramazzottius varieornatus]